MAEAETEESVVSEPATLLQMLTTEEFVLQSTRASTISESSSRATIFLGSVSSGLIAIAPTANGGHVGNTFYALALTVLPTLVFLGLFSYGRIMQTGIEDLACAAPSSESATSTRSCIRSMRRCCRDRNEPAHT